MFETLFILFVGGVATNATISRQIAERRLASRIVSQDYSPRPQVHSPITKEGLALGKKAYLGPKSVKRQKALQFARLKRKHS